MQYELNIILDMSGNNKEQRQGINKRVLLFFLFAVMCVAAFLIVILVKSCEADHEEKVEDQLLQEEVSMNSPSIETIQMLG